MPCSFLLTSIIVDSKTRDHLNATPPICIYMHYFRSSCNQSLVEHTSCMLSVSDTFGFMHASALHLLPCMHVTLKVDCRLLDTCRPCRKRAMHFEMLASFRPAGHLSFRDRHHITSVRGNGHHQR